MMNVTAVCGRDNQSHGRGSHGWRVGGGRTGHCVLDCAGTWIWLVDWGSVSMEGRHRTLVQLVERSHAHGGSTMALVLASEPASQHLCGGSDVRSGALERRRMRRM